MLIWDNYNLFRTHGHSVIVSTHKDRRQFMADDGWPAAVTPHGR